MKASKRPVLISLFAAILSIISPMSIPIGSVPVTMTTFLLIFGVLLLGTRITLVSVIVYIILGSIGIPVFSGFTGGIGVLVSVTGGFIIGYIPMVILLGVFIRLFSKNGTHKLFYMMTGVFSANIILYLFGAVHFSVVSQIDFLLSLGVSVLPFIPIDIIKSVIAVLLANKLKNRLKL